jgi:Tfp pilus assembly protein FimT
MRARAGFTLWEMAITFAIMTVMALLVAPAIGRFGDDQPKGSADQLLALLRDARKAAIAQNTLVTLRVDPASGRYQADTTGARGSGLLVEGRLDLGAAEVLITDQPRLLYIFRATGAAFADTVLVRGTRATVLVSVDPWSGVAHADAR